MSSVTDVDIQAADIRREAERQGENRISRMAIVAGTTVGYGLSRMFQTLADETDYEIEVFRKVDDALKWLERELPDA